MNPGTEVRDAALTTSVFQTGELAVELIEVNHSKDPAPPIDILVSAPKDAGTYPVAMFLHGFCLQNRVYKQILKHVASFGFIMVAPQFSQFGLNILDQSDTEDIAAAAQVTNWLTEGLPAVLHNGIKPNLSKLALAGHSRGGHTAFSLVLGHGSKTNLKFSAIIGVDPVAGQGENSQISPKILTKVPSSLDIAMPALVIGTGLGEEPKKVFGIPVVGPSAPNGVNHKEFYLECKPPCYHIVTKDYGHLDMLDDDAPWQINVMKSLIMQGDGSKDMMRRTVAGILVSFLKAKLNGEDGDLQVILKDPKLAPVTLDPVEYSLS